MQKLTLWEQHAPGSQQDCHSRPKSKQFHYIAVCELEQCATKRALTNPTK